MPYIDRCQCINLINYELLGFTAVLQPEDSVDAVIDILKKPEHLKSTQIHDFTKGT